MPLVRIDARRATPERLDALGAAVHDALVETVGIPEDDLFQILTSHDGPSSTVRYSADYLGVHRDDDVVLVAITLSTGRGDDRKRALYRRIAELAHERAGTEPRDVVVVLTENGRVDWSFGDGVAQYVPG